jgi:predicted nucleic acid-binding protein
MNIFVDTNIILDVLAHRRPFYAPAAGLWTLAESGRIRAFVSSVSYANTYYVVRKLSGKGRAAQSLRQMRGVFETVSVDAQIINQAIDAEFRDFEEAIQYFCAVRSRARYLVTRNPRHFPTDAPTPIAAKEFMALSETI